MNIPADYELLQTLAHQASQLRHHSIANSQMSQTLQVLQQQHKAELDRRDEQIKEQQQRIDDMAARLNAPRITDEQRQVMGEAREMILKATNMRVADLGDGTGTQGPAKPE